MPFEMPVDDNDLENNSSYKNSQSNHECVEFVRQGTGAPMTALWKKGINVMEAQIGTIKRGTAIATFNSAGKYPIANRHAAIYVSHDLIGITVYDQWNAQAKVKKRIIRKKSPTDFSVDNALNYFVIEK